jgi:hypothetical protein
MDADIMTKMGQLILDGLTEEEAALLCNINQDELSTIKETDTAYNEFIARKNVEFKHEHLKQIKKTPDPKNSQWILERLRPKEFSAVSSRNNVGSAINLVASIISQVQEDNRTLIPRHGTQRTSSPENLGADDAIIGIGGASEKPLRPPLEA